MRASGRDEDTEWLSEADAGLDLCHSASSARHLLYQLLPESTAAPCLRRCVWRTRWTCVRSESAFRRCRIQISTLPPPVNIETPPKSAASSSDTRARENIGRKTGGLSAGESHAVRSIQRKCDSLTSSAYDFRTLFQIGRRISAVLQIAGQHMLVADSHPQTQAVLDVRPRERHVSEDTR